jgi:hypothetical protein
MDPGAYGPAPGKDPRVALTEKLEMLEDRVRGTVAEAKTAVRQSVDLNYHVRQRPWLMMGLSVFVGYTLGRLFGGRGNGRVETAVDDRAARAATLKGATVAALATVMKDLLVKEAVPAAVGFVKRRSRRQKAPPSGDSAGRSAEPGGEEPL